MNGLSNIFDVTSSALNAQSVHIDLIAKNMANAQVVSSNEQDAYRARRPEFATLMTSAMNRGGMMNNGSFMDGPMSSMNTNSGVKVNRLLESSSPINKQRMPESPLADEDGYVYMSNVNLVEEMAYMMEASRAYQSNIEVLNTSKQLMLRTLSLGS